MSRSKKDLMRKGGLFIPLIYSFGATCEDLPLDVFLDDPTKISNSLRTINTFLDADGTVCCGNERMLSESLRSTCSMADDSFMDPGVKASATLMEAGIERLVSEGRPAIALEVAKRLGILMPESIVLTVVAGPVKLASQLTGLPPEDMLQHPDFLSLTTKAILTFLRAMGETGVDMVVIREDAASPIDTKFSTVLNRCYSPLWNTAKFYGMHALLMPEQFAPENGALYKKMVNKVIFPTGTSTEALEKFRKPSFSIPCSLLEKEMDEIESFLFDSDIIRFLKSKKLFLVTTDQEVPGSIHKERMIEGIKKIKDLLMQHET
jgi:hypothetical protein